MTDLQRRLGRLRAARVVGIVLVAVNAASLAVDLVTAPVTVFLPATLIAVLLPLIVLETLLIRSTRARTARAGDARRGVFVQPEVGLPPGFVLPSVALAPPRSAWDVSLTLNPSVPWNDVVHYEDASRKPDEIANGVIRVIPRTAVRPWSLGAPVVTSWTLVTRAPSHGEGIDLLKAAEPLLRERLAEPAELAARYFRLAGGELAEVPGMFGACAAETGERLAASVPSVSMKDVELGLARLTAALGPCAHPDAEPVDLLVTGERVAWVCPKCGAELPADWR